jgi:hypothetical protein
MSKSWEEIVKEYKLAAKAGGGYDTSQITGDAERQYVEKRAKLQRQAEMAKMGAESAAAEARTVGQVSHELEKADTLLKKMQKYMPIMEKQAGMTGLGVSESMKLRAQNDHTRAMNAARRARGETVDAAVGGIWNNYKSYVESLQPEIDAADQEFFAAKLGENKGAVDDIYGDYSLDAAGRRAAVDSLLSGITDASMRTSLREYITGLEGKAAVIDKLQELYTSPSNENGVTLKDYEEAAAGGSLWDRMTPEEQEKLFEWYQSLSGEDRLTADEYLEYVNENTIGDAQSKMDRIDQRVDIKLGVLGEPSAEDIKAILESDEFKNMSASKRRYLEDTLYELETTKDAYNVPDDETLELVENEYAILQENPTTERLTAFLAKYPNAPTDMLDNVRNALARQISAGDLTKEQIKGLDDTSAEAYIASLKALLNEDGTPNLDLISEKFYKSYVDPEIKEFNEVWDAYRKKSKEISNEKYAKQMAGEEPIVDEGGRKWYVAASIDGDVESFMDKNKEAVNKELKEYGNAYNPNIPDKTVIKVKGIHLVYDKEGKKWNYALTKTESAGRVSMIGTADGRFVHDGVQKNLMRITSKSALESINALGLGENIPDGKTVNITVNGRNKECVYFDGRWHFLH